MTLQGLHYYSRVQRFWPMKFVNWKLLGSHQKFDGRDREEGGEGEKGGEGANSIESFFNFLRPSFIQWSACWAFSLRSAAKDG
jgi:hypothetical protein